MGMLRLDKILADTGRWSRSEARTLIRAGRVAVSGVPLRRPEEKADPEQDCISVDGTPLRWQRRVCLMLDKPAGVLSATEDRTQQTVLDLLPPEYRKMGLFPVGRLDRDTTGLLLLTDDGDLAHEILSPKKHVPKRYRAEVAAPLSDEDVKAFAEGLTLGDGTQCLPAGLELEEGGMACFVTVFEGKYHQVKRMLASRGCPVTALRRLRIGALELDASLGSGGWRELDEMELMRVFNNAQNCNQVEKR